MAKVTKEQYYLNMLRYLAAMRVTKKDLKEEIVWYTRGRKYVRVVLLYRENFGIPRIVVSDELFHKYDSSAPNFAQYNRSGIKGYTPPPIKTNVAEFLDWLHKTGARKVKKPRRRPLRPSIYD